MLRTITLADLQEQRNRLNTAVAPLTDTNRVHEFNEAMRKLEEAFDYFEKNGEFDSGERRVEVYRSAKIQETKQDHSDDVKHAKMIIARAGLRLQQKSIPAIKAMADRCLELAGADAVRAVCAPTQRDGTDIQGKLYKPTPSEFTLPAGYEPVGQKIKTLIGM